MNASDNTEPAVGLPEYPNRWNVPAQTECRIRYYAGHPGQIDERLDALDGEEDLESALQCKGSAVALAGLVLGILGKRKFLALSAAALGCLCQQSAQGWSPAATLLRRLGFRTRREIDQEREALRLLRGDFRSLNEGEESTPHVERVLEAVGFVS